MDEILNKNIVKMTKTIRMIWHKTKDIISHMAKPNESNQFNFCRPRG